MATSKAEEIVYGGHFRGRCATKYGGPVSSSGERRPSKDNPVVVQKGDRSSRPSFLTLVECRERLSAVLAALETLVTHHTPKGEDDPRDALEAEREALQEMISASTER